MVESPFGKRGRSEQPAKNELFPDIPPENNQVSPQIIRRQQRTIENPSVTGANVVPTFSSEMEHLERKRATTGRQRNGFSPIRPPETPKVETRNIGSLDTGDQPAFKEDFYIESPDVDRLDDNIFGQSLQIEDDGPDTEDIAFPPKEPAPETPTRDLLPRAQTLEVGVPSEVEESVVPEVVAQDAERLDLLRKQLDGDDDTVSKEEERTGVLTKKPPTGSIDDSAYQKLVAGVRSDRTPNERNQGIQIKEPFGTADGQSLVFESESSDAEGLEGLFQEMESQESLEKGPRLNIGDFVRPGEDEISLFRPAGENTLPSFHTERFVGGYHVSPSSRSLISLGPGLEVSLGALLQESQFRTGIGGAESERREGSTQTPLFNLPTTSELFSEKELEALAGDYDPDQTQIFGIELPENTSLDQKRSIRQLQYYEEVMQQAPKMSLAEGEQFTFDTFRRRPQERGDIYEQRMIQEMMGKNFLIGGKNYQIISYGGGGGFSYGFIAQETRSIENPFANNKVEEQVNTQGEKLFVKFIDTSKAGSHMSRQTQDLFRHFTWREIDTMLNLSNQGYDSSPEIKGILPFGGKYDAQSTSIDDFPITPKSVDYRNSDGELQTIESYFIDIEATDQDNRFAGFTIPERVVVAMTFEEGGELADSVKKDVAQEFEVELGTEHVLELSEQVRNALQQIIQEQNTQRQPAEVGKILKDFVEGVVEKTYQQPDSFSKFFVLVESLTTVLQHPGGGAAERQILQQEIEHLYSLIEEYQEIADKHVRQIDEDFVQKLKKLHTLGIVHRDLKLQNILGREGQSILIDFGLAEREVQLLDKEHTKGYIHQEIVGRFKKFLLDNGKDEEEFEALGAQLESFIKSQKEGDDAFALFDHIRSICGRSGAGERILEQKSEELIKDFLRINENEQDLFKRTRNEEACDLFTGYRYLLAGKDRAAALAISNPIDYMGRGMIFGTPNKTYPAQILTQSTNFGLWKAYVEERLNKLEEGTKRGTNEASQFIELRDLHMLVAHYEHLIQLGKANSKTSVRLEKIRAVLADQTGNDFTELELDDQELGILHKGFHHQYGEIRTVLKYAAMSQRQVDVFASVLTLLDLRANVKLDKESYPKLMDYSVVEFGYADEFAPFIRNLFLDLRRVDNSEFFTSKMQEVMNCDGVLRGDINAEILQAENRPSLKDVMSEQEQIDAKLTGKDLVLHNAQLNSLRVHLGRFYTVLRRELSDMRTEESALMRLRQQNAADPQLAPRIQALQDRVANKGNFFRSHLHRLNNTLRGDLQRIQQMYSEV